MFRLFASVTLFAVATGTLADVTGNNALRDLLAHPIVEQESHDGRYVSCGDVLISREDLFRFPVVSQYIFNAMYSWAEIDVEEKRCVYMISPDHTGLSADDAARFMSATQSDFPVPESPKSETESAGAVGPKPVDTSDKANTLDMRTGEPIEEIDRKSI